MITIVPLYGQRTASAEILAGQLQVALDTRVVIEQAEGIVAERLGIPPKKSWERLRRMARSSNSSLQDVSQAVIDGLTPPR